MKDKRNCNNNMNYPIYPAPQNFQSPMMMPPIGYPNYQTYPNYAGELSNNTIEQQINNLEQQINLLDQRITKLEKQNTNMNNYNKYNDSNYYMV